MSPNAESPQSGRWVLLLFAAVVFASAFLIFLVQPMVGKRILPWFGGAPAVWTLCLAFYQTTLFAGYAYAHCVIRYVPPAFQFPALRTVPFRGAVHASSPSERRLDARRWLRAEPRDPDPARRSRCPALSRARRDRSAGPGLVRTPASRPLPYPLYAVSNTGSLLAMLGYPFLLEPRLPLSTTGQLWSIAFAATGAGVLACAHLAGRGADGAQRISGLPADGTPTALRLGAARVALWISLSACTVMLLMGVTNELCLDVASVPFLWILPLSVYLISFILCFRSDRSNRRAPYLFMAALPLILPAVSNFLGPGAGGIFALAHSVRGQIASLCLLLFGACMVLHGELHRLRPPARSLTTFYLCISGGGALGGVFVGLVAPRIFDDYHEFQIGLGLGCLLLLGARWHDSRGWLHRTAPRWRWAAAAAVTAILLGHWGFGGVASSSELLLKQRTFFGLLRVYQLEAGVSEQRHLVSGTTLHGVQFPNQERRPTSYYGEATGIGLALAQRESNEPRVIGVVGLGIGTLAAYGRPGDQFRFYEINPAVIQIARDTRYFSYLAHSPADLEIVEGDARVSLALELKRGGKGRFDILIIDAFSSDAIPIHLMTREAFELYGKAIKTNGLLAVHTSNRRLDLKPLVARLGESTGFTVVAIATGAAPQYLSAASVWVFLSRDRGRFLSLAQFADARRQQLGLPAGAIRFREYSAAELANTPLWTDDYSDLFGALKPNPVRSSVEPES